MITCLLYISKRGMIMSVDDVLINVHWVRLTMYIYPDVIVDKLKQGHKNVKSIEDTL